jgi:uncharacterized membrane protein YcaP (DUF421 family)
MFDMSISVGEHVVRAVAVYAFLFVLLRWVGKKHVGELSPFDLIVLLILSETVQNAMISDDTSLTGGLVSAGTLIVLAQVMDYVSWKSKRASRLLEGTPKVLVRHGRCIREAMRSERVTISELTEAMRTEGCANIADVRFAILENDGNISVIKRESA